MSQTLEPNLKTILDAIDKPCFIEKNNEILYFNKTFTSRGYNVEEIRTNSDFDIEEKKINDGMKLCEVNLNDIKQINECRQKITTALNLL